MVEFSQFAKLKKDYGDERHPDQPLEYLTISSRIQQISPRQSQLPQKFFFN
ncbi:unnamed protein product [Paramecium octaurelia]|uniref:Uncharacterized protein n=1 Tax=Paramecium octaurelia TaxID=43137 RepID=A0A8S1VT01_PAROT|nr:unnamed protein product [Paramecium octaurelia]